MKRFLTMYKIEQKIYFRSPDVILFGLLMPVVVFALITMIGGNKEAADSGLTFLQSAFVSLSTVGICCTAFPCKLWDEGEKCLTLSAFEWDKKSKILLYGQVDYP